MCAAGGGAKHDPICADVLLQKLFHCKCISQRAGRAGSTIGDKVRFSSVANCFIVGLLQGLVTERSICNCDDFRPEHLVKQQIRRRLIGQFTIQHEDAIQTKARCCGGRLAAVVRLQSAACDQGLCALFQSFGNRRLFTRASRRKMCLRMGSMVLQCAFLSRMLHFYGGVIDAERGQ